LSIEAAAENPAPYNLLVTRQWLLLIPRSKKYFEGISINALGFAGVLLVKDTAQLAILQKHGPMTALQRVGYHGSREASF
jgi:ATP adenylyltransferase